MEDLRNSLSLFLFFVTSEIITLHSQLSNIQTKKPNSANHGTEETNMDGKAGICICWQERHLHFLVQRNLPVPTVSPIIKKWGRGWLKQERDQKKPHKISPTTHQAMHGVIKVHHDRIKRTNALSMSTTTLHRGGDRRCDTMLVATMEAVTTSTTNTHQAMHGIIEDCHGRCRRTNAPPTASRTLHHGGDM